MRKRLSEIKNLDIFRITEKIEEPIDTEDNNSVLEYLESLKAEIVKLGKSQIQARMKILPPDP